MKRRGTESTFAVSTFDVPVVVLHRLLLNPVSQRDWDDAHLTNTAWGAPLDDPVFSHRFIADELKQAGVTVGENRVRRLWSQ